MTQEQPTTDAFGIVTEDERLDKELLSRGRREVTDTFVIFRHNALAAISYEESLNTSPLKLMGLWSPKEPQPPDEMFRPAAILLHNVLASATTLIDHTRNHVRRCYHHHSFYEAYNQKVQTVFAQQDLPQFIQGLRNFTMHHSLPITSATVSLAPNVSHRHRFQLERDRLLEDFDWNQAARAFVTRQEAKFAIFPLIRDYQQAVTDFHVWREAEEQKLWHRAMLAQHGPNSRIAREAPTVTSIESESFPGAPADPA
jgi:hypothetical protein